MLKGEQGLGAFLNDGTGYSKSGFKPRSKRAGAQDDAPLGGPDPLPWLKLPQFDYVDVAGQETESRLDPEQEKEIMSRLEDLADLLKNEVQNNNIEEASHLRRQLENLMEEYGYQYEPER